MDSLKLKLDKVIREIPDFPKHGIMFKDITPIFKDHALCTEIISALADYYKDMNIQAVAGIESRGFLFGTDLARILGVPFIPIRKVGKLPYDKISHKYELEYGYAEIEMHTDAINPGDKVIIHDDLLATGGTACAAAELIQKMEGEVIGYSFLINLEFLKGREKLKAYGGDIHALIEY